MATRLPNGNEAIVDIRKVEDYCLNPTHPRGRHKARVFREALDLKRSDAPWLHQVLVEAARSGEALQVASDAWGVHWRIDAAVRRHGKAAVVSCCERASACPDSLPVGCYDAGER